MPYVKKADLDRLLSAGTSMANACFNVKQTKWLPEQERALFAAMQTRWDEACAALIPKRNGGK